MGVILPFVKPVTAAPMTQTEMRRLAFRVCHTCGHEWTQPALAGACPNCHSENTTTVDVGVCAAPYRR